MYSESIFHTYTEGSTAVAECTVFTDSLIHVGVEVLQIQATVHAHRPQLGYCYTPGRS